MCLGPACAQEPASVAPEPRPRTQPAPVLSADDEALLASLLADDPSDFHRERARIWRIGDLRWIAQGPELPGRPADDPRQGTLERAVEVVVVDAAGPRVLLPLDALTPAPGLDELWSALRMVAVVSSGDLVAGLRRELHPTEWLTLSAGVALTPLGREQDHLRVSWSDPACGFGLELALDTEDFGPSYEPGPSGPPAPVPAEPSESGRRLAPGTALYASAESKEAVLQLDTKAPSAGQRMSAAQHVELRGEPKRGRQPITLSCRGVRVEGWVEAKAIESIPSRYAVVQSAPMPASSCAEIGEERISVPPATPLYEPKHSGETSLVGVVTREVELLAQPGAEGWWTGCAPSPWGDLVFQFQLR